MFEGLEHLTGDLRSALTEILADLHQRVSALEAAAQPELAQPAVQ